jgi:hypothetical protein
MKHNNRQSFCPFAAAVHCDHDEIRKDTDGWSDRERSATKLSRERRILCCREGEGERERERYLAREREVERTVVQGAFARRIESEGPAAACSIFFASVV